MKKIMIAAAIACAAAMSQAATVKWASENVYAAADSTGKYSTTVKITSGTASLYNITAAQYSEWVAAIAADQATGMATVYDAMQKETAIATASLNKSKFTLTDSRDISAATGADPIDLYSAIIYTYTDGDGKDWYVANVGTAHFEANTSKTIGNMNTFVAGDATGAAITGWQTAAVPEPTSGLLLLLGVAGMALRRRRA